MDKQIKLSAKEWLQEVEPFFIAALEEKRMRGKVVEILENYSNYVSTRVSSPSLSDKEIEELAKEKFDKSDIKDAMHFGMGVICGKHFIEKPVELMESSLPELMKHLEIKKGLSLSKLIDE